MAKTPFILAATLATAASGNRFPLEARSAQTSAVCLSDFSWTDNSKNVSPCLLAATVLASCAGNNWTVRGINATTHYTPPKAADNSVNLCSCSWAAYNLLSACTLCQGFGQSIQNWPHYKEECGDKLSSTYFPSQLVLPEGTTIPFYAATDPTTWSDQRFNLQQAKAIADQGHSDLLHVTEEQKRSSSPVGPIVGGVIGGLVILALAGGIAFYMIRKKERQHSGPRPLNNVNEGPGHNRTGSDFSQKSNGIGIGYQQMDRSFTTSPSTRPPMSPNTMHTHTGSVNSLSYFGSVNNSIAPYGSPPAPPSRVLSPSPPPVHSGVNREDIIVPFTLSPSPGSTSHQGSSSNLTDRKRADGAIIPVYDSPNSPPSQNIQSAEPSAPRRARVNPPAYSPYPTTRGIDESSQAPVRRPQIHSKKGSADTNRSTDSIRSGNTTTRHGSMGTGGGGSLSAIDDVIGQMGFGSATETVSGSGGTLGTGLSTQMPRQHVFRPTVGNPDP